MTSTPHRRKRRAVAVAAALGLAVLASGVGSASAATAEAELAADQAADWLTDLVNTQGFVPGPTDDPDVSATLDIAVSFVASRSEEATFERIMAWARANTEAIVVVGGHDDPGRLGILMVLARAAGTDPTDFGGVDLPARLAGTLGDFTAGLYGAADPTYDGVFRHSLAILGLVAAGVAVPDGAVSWLVEQQCDLPAAATGGWVAFRADTGVDCPPPDPVSYTGPDTNSTAMAVQALAAVGGQAPVTDAALAFLDGAQSADGEWGFVPGSSPDPNSASLVVQAIVAGGAEGEPRWVENGTDPYGALLSWRINGGTDDGAFASPFSGGASDVFATRQAAWGLSGEPFPFLYDPFPPTGPNPNPNPNPGPNPGPQHTGGGQDGSSGGVVATPVAITPRFTG